jgi:hypothetical protein
MVHVFGILPLPAPYLRLELHPILNCLAEWFWVESRIYYLLNKIYPYFMQATA